jgi:hypothetical protein
MYWWIKDMDQPRRRLADLTSQELLRRTIEYRHMATVARGNDTEQSLNRLALRFALLAARREIEEGVPISETEAHQEPTEVAKLARLAEHAATNELDPVRILADIIKAVAEGTADPYLLSGVLVEGSVHTLETRIPTERQGDTAEALLQLMTDRLRANGFLDRR